MDRPTKPSGRHAVRLRWDEIITRLAYRFNFLAIRARGTAIVAPGTTFTSEIATFINFFAWQGKMFGAKASLLVNEIFDLRAKVNYRQGIQTANLDRWERVHRAGLLT